MSVRPPPARPSPLCNQCATRRSSAVSEAPGEAIVRPTHGGFAAESTHLHPHAPFLHPQLLPLPSMSRSVVRTFPSAVYNACHPKTHFIILKQVCSHYGKALSFPKALLVLAPPSPWWIEGLNVAARFSFYLSIRLPCYFAQVGASRVRNVPKILAPTIRPPERGPSSIRLPRYAHHWPPNQDPRSVGPRRAATANMFAAGWLRTRAAPGRRLSFFSGRPVFTRQRGTHTKPAGEPRPNPLFPIR